jgi:hypothetical protein
MGHESVATQPTFLQLVKTKELKFSIKFSNFFQLNQCVPLFVSNVSVNLVVKIYKFWKNLFKQCILILFNF